MTQYLLHDVCCVDVGWELEKRLDIARIDISPEMAKSVEVAVQENIVRSIKSTTAIVA